MAELKITLNDTVLGSWTFTDDDLAVLSNFLTSNRAPGRWPSTPTKPQEALVSWARQFVTSTLGQIQSYQLQKRMGEVRTEIQPLPIVAATIDVDAVGVVLSDAKVAGVNDVIAAPPQSLGVKS